MAVEMREAARHMNVPVPRVDTSVALFKGVGKKKVASLADVGIHTAGDLLYMFPRTYEDRRNRQNIGSLKDGETVGFIGKILSASSKPTYYAKGKKTPLYLLAGDDTGSVELVFFNSKYIDRILTVGKAFFFFGTPQVNRGRLQMVHPDFERIDEEQDSAHPIMPVYSLKGGFNQKEMRRWHESALPAADSLIEYIPKNVIDSERLRSISYALRNIHYPDDKSALSEARYRLIFEELLTLQSGLLRLRSSRESGERGAAKDASVVVEEFEKLLPYRFTGAQRRVTREVYADMESDSPMNRLVQGDVGSGKTAVAAAAIYKAVKSGYQAVMMAPTEILAKQHYGDLSALFAGISEVVLMTSGMPAKERRAALSGLATGDTMIAVGTHALISPDVDFHRLGLVITDEQHRFGVNQRIALARKNEGTQEGDSISVPEDAGCDSVADVMGHAATGNPGSLADTGSREVPDVLVMTATPIPRSLAFVIYGDLDMSVIDEMPPGRRSVITEYMNENKRDVAYKILHDEVERGGQAYVVAPLIEDNEDSAVTADLRSAQSLYDEISERFPDRLVALLHGRMKQNEKDEVMASFASGETDILVSTVVIEVGVNVPNATVMIIENSERFGLAQMHQLRGRVGRGRAQSYCVLILGSDTGDALTRAETMRDTDDGFKIAEMDLSLRGPGDLFGVRQHGIPALMIANLARHVRIAEKAKVVAETLLGSDPMLVKEENRAFGDRVEAMFRDVSDIGL